MKLLKKLLYVVVIGVLVACQSDREFKGFPLVGKKYPLKADYPSPESKISDKFMVPSPGGVFFEPFQEVNVHYITSSRKVIRVVGTRTYVDHDSCDAERVKLWNLAKGYFGPPTDNGHGDWNFNFGDQVLNIFCGGVVGSAYAFLNVNVSDVPLINKQIQMHIDAAKH